RRRRAGEEAGAAGAGGAGAAAAAAGIAAGAGSAAGAGAAVAAARPSEGDELLEDAKKLVAEVEDALAEHLEEHPDGAAQVSGAMEKLELARDFIKEGDGEAAMQFAMEARAALGGVVGGVAGRAGGGPAVAEGQAKKPSGALRCPSCGEALEPEWPMCPACGHKTR
ncbi:MAG: zinc ribbon domain-containing protein, partial [Thermoplasmata archaeon]